MPNLEIQEVTSALGNYGCYFLSILRHFNQEENCIKWFRKAVGLKYMGADCYLERPDLIAQMVSGKRWKIFKAAPDYKLGPKEWEVLRYELKRPGVTTAHFVLPDWDPLGKSVTRSQGQLVSKRVFKEV